MTATISDGTLFSDGTTVAELDPGQGLRDDQHRIPAFAALALRTGGRYAENGLGLGIDDALAVAELDFVVRKHGPIGVRTPTGDYLQLGDGDITDWHKPTDGEPDDGEPTDPVEFDEIEGLKHLRATVATWPGQPGKAKRLLGVVGRAYPVVQPRQTAELAQAIVDEGGGTIVAICAYGEPRGSQMLLAVKQPEGLLIGGHDRHDLHLVVGNSFNRSSSLWGCAAPTRIDCHNQVAGIFGGRGNRFSMSHRGNMEGKVEQAREALRITGTFAQHYAAAAEVMLATPLAGARVDTYVEELFPTPERVGKLGQDRAALRRRHIADIIRTGPRNQMGVGTAYAAYQGVVEWLDHIMPSHTERTRLTRLVNGGELERRKAFAARLALAA